MLSTGWLRDNFLAIWLVVLFAVFFTNQRGATLALVLMALLALSLESIRKITIPYDYSLRILGAVPQNLLLLVLALVAWMSLSFFWAPAASSSWHTPLALLSIALCLCITIAFVTDHPQKIDPLIASIVLVSFALLQIWLSRGDNYFERVNILPKFHNRILLTGVLIVIAYAGIIWMSSLGRRLRFIGLLGCLALSYAMAFFGESQTALLVWLICWPLLLGLVLTGAWMRRLVLYGACTVPLIMPFLLYFGSTLVSNLSGQGFKLFQHSSSALRLEIWKSSVNLMAMKPIAGWGFDSFQDAFPMAKAAPVFPQTLERVFSHPHNAFLQIGVEMGLVGLVLVTLIMVVIAKSILTLPARSLPFAITLFAGVTIVNSVSHGAWQTWWLATMVLLAALATGFYRRPHGAPNPDGGSSLL